MRVADVLARASVGRSTFYEHFADKEALLESTLARLGETLTRAAEQEARPFAFVRPLLEHVGGQRELFLRLKGSRSGAL
ncbi:MAG TPA: TetR family transcriptional regulator, partial [Polyangiaceae bacterium]|nr:TetR family transcriptional regulator [Polyangiaceae bacterium]